MKIDMQSTVDASRLLHCGWDLAIVGNALDARGEAALDFARSQTKEQVTCSYIAETFGFMMDARICQADGADADFVFCKGRSVLLETTTLSFPEVYLACRGLKAQPGRRRPRKRRQGVLL